MSEDFETTLRHEHARKIARAFLVAFLTPNPEHELIERYAGEIRKRNGIELFAAGLAAASRIRGENGAGDRHAYEAARLQERVEAAERRDGEHRVDLEVAEQARQAAERSMDAALRDIALDMELVGATEPLQPGRLVFRLPGRGRRLLRKANAYRDSGRCFEAAELYLLAYTCLPHRADLLAQSGNMYKDSGDVATAERLYLQAISRLGQAARPCLTILADMYAGWGRPHRARAAAERAAALPE